MTARKSDDVANDQLDSTLLTVGTTSDTAGPRGNIFLSVCSFIIVAEFCERLAYYGLTGSITLFFRDRLNMSNTLATQLSSAFTSWNYITPLLGAYLADTYIGRFNAIWSFCCIYLVGLILCTVAALPDSTSSPLFFTGLMLGVAVGSGGIKPNVVVLGAEQFDPDIPAEEEQKDSYFNYFYWAINIGAVISFGFLAYLAVNGLGSFIPVKWGFFASFLIPTVAMSITLTVFLAGSSRYKTKPPEGSALSKFVKVLVAGARRQWHGRALVIGGAVQIPGIILTVISYFQKEGSSEQQIFALCGGALILLGVILLVIFGADTFWLQTMHGEEDFTEDEIEDVSDVLRLLPYVGYLIMFWTIYSQMQGSFIVQGCQMDLRIGSGTISAAQLNLFDCVVILALIPVFDSWVYPAFERHGLKLTPLKKIGAGFVFCVLSMLVAALVEVERRNAPLLVKEIVNGTESYYESNCDDTSSSTKTYMSAFSVWYQIPQYLLIGIAEILTAITTYDLFYSQVPSTMRSVCQALNLLTVTLGSMASSAVLSILASWYTSNLNKGRLDYIFLVFAGMMVINIFFFIISSRGFEYKGQHAALRELQRKSSSASGRSSMAGRSFVESAARDYSKSMLGITSFTDTLDEDDLYISSSRSYSDGNLSTPRLRGPAGSFAKVSFLKGSFMGGS